MDPGFFFRHPSVLALLFLPLVLLVATWRRSGRAVVLPFDHGSASPGSGARFCIRAAESIPALLLAIAIVLLAGPERWEEPRSKRLLTNIEFCVDVSGSMTARFEDGDRYSASMKAINDFLGYREGDAFGLTFFGNAVLHWVPLTSDVSAFACAPPFMHPANLPPWFGGTEIGKALLACRKVLVEREVGDRMIVLVTDGYSADLSGGRDEEIAARLRDDGITVYCVHVADGEIPGEVVTIAANTGGEAFKAGDGAGLQRVFEHIDRLQETRLEKTHEESVDDFGPWCRAALALAGLFLLALFGLRYTPW